MVRLTLQLTDEEAAKLGSVVLRSDWHGSQSPVMQSLARKIQSAIADAEPEPDEVVYVDLGGEG